MALAEQSGKFFFLSYSYFTQCTYEIDRLIDSRVTAELRVSDREAGKSVDSLLCVRYIPFGLSNVLFTGGCYSLPFSTLYVVWLQLDYSVCSVT